MLVKDEEPIIEFDGDELLNLNKFGLESIRFKSNDGIDNGEPSCVETLNQDDKNTEIITISKKINHQISYFFAILDE